MKTSQLIEKMARAMQYHGDMEIVTQELDASKLGAIHDVTDCGTGSGPNRKFVLYFNPHPNQDN